MAFPVGYSWSFGERIQEQDRQLEQMIVNYLLALALIYIVMASQFESLVHPFAILFSIPFAFWGVTWFLLVTNTPLNFHGANRSSRAHGYRRQERHRAHRPHQQLEAGGI